MINLFQQQQIRSQEQNQNQPIGEKLASESETQFKKELTSESEVTKTNKTPPKQKAAIIQSSHRSERTSDSNETEIMNKEIMQVTHQPPIKTPVRYTLNQIEVLQTLGNFTFMLEYETDEFFQKTSQLLKKLDSTKIICLPTP